ncbi:MAG: hypothetical protein ICV68_06350 [Pyrinomonadaceae bacterium]|nr:hypothetical protein [Pyrinomonadaceae bacterium]
MRREKRRVMIASFLLMMLASVVSVFAQEAPPPPPRPPRGEGDVIMFERRIGPPPPGVGPQIDVLPQGQGPGETFVFVSTEMSFGHKIVKNAPYSAQATTETTQILADGNRIVRKNTANVYRDSEGRTRHDQSLSSIGPWAAAGEPQQTSFIGDPVSRVHYILEPRTRIARKLPLPPHPPLRAPGAPDAKHDMRVRVITPPNGSADKAGAVTDEDINIEVGHDANVVVRGDARRVARDKKVKDNLKREALGKQTIEGVEAEGTRETFTIPAGEIGNEQPIQVVSERWYSPALQTVVLTKHSDPRFGETTFRLTNINRSEPARSLFEVPADYTIKEGPGAQRIFRRKLNEEK